MKILIVDNRVSEKCERALEKEGFYLIKLPPDPTLNDAVSSHPDTVLFSCPGELITTADYCDAATYIFSDIRELSPDVKISFTCDVRSPLYPHDCIMNALVIENRIFCKTDTVSKVILDLAARKGYDVIHTNQGYPACSVLAFGNSAITADEGLASLLRGNGIRVTLISSGNISLPPYEYGFIGGASGVVGSKVYFFGSLDSHPDCELIRQTITGAGFTPISLSDEPLRDLGGIISL